MTLEDIYLLGPEISLAGLAISLILLGLMVSNGRLLTITALVGLLIPLGISISLWLPQGRVCVFEGFLVRPFFV